MNKHKIWPLNVSTFIIVKASLHWHYTLFFNTTTTTSGTMEKWQTTPCNFARVRCYLFRHMYIHSFPTTIGHQWGRCSGCPGWAKQAWEVLGHQTMPHLHTCGYGDGRPFRARNSLLPERTRLPLQVDDWPWRSQIFQLPAAKSIQSCTSLFPVCVCITLCHWEL